ILATGHFSFATFTPAFDHEEIFAFMANRVTVSPVIASIPEPLSLTMMGAGLIGLAALRRRQRPRASARK
ncbi:MAG TPA: PEP-CTERM sorting domain-containing protein, partial [Rhizomicrobium sp.]|nr:PEP-CTERM sorting domain-containing protein [Rhizomicrobium sp.]